MISTCHSLNEIQNDKCIVMEPLVRMGGTVSSDIKVWRDLSNGASDDHLDHDVKDSLIFSRLHLNKR